MNAQLEVLIHNLLSSDNNLIKKATEELKEAYKLPQTIPALCDIVVAGSEPAIRQYSAVLLTKRLGKRRNWRMVPEDQQAIIKKGMLNALVVEPEKPVRNSIAQFVGVLVRHEGDKKDSWMTEVLQFIYERCSSTDPRQSELGSSIFSALTDTAPDQFVPHMAAVCDMLTAALITAENSGNMATPVIFNIMSGMMYLIPFTVGHHNAEHTLVKAVPLIVKALQAFSVQPDVDQFIRAFDILESMAEYTPKLLTNHIKMLMELCLEISNNDKLEGAVRVKTIIYIGWLTRLKKKIVVKQKMVEPILQVLFNMMVVETDDDDDDDYFIGSNSNPMTAATQTLDVLALNVPPEKLIPYLLQILEPALQGQDHLRRRAAYLCMAVIAEGCSEYICNKYLETMLNIIKVGITDPSAIVRNSAFFALGQFSEYLQPEISNYAPQILPVLFEFLHQLCLELRSGVTEPKHIDRMFYALEIFCEQLSEALVPHLPLLMERLFEALNPNNSTTLRQLALSTVSAASNACKEQMMPYFEQLCNMLRPYLVKNSENEDILTLRCQAMQTLASLARTVGKHNFLPLASNTMGYAIDLLEEADDPDVRRSAYILIAALSEVVNDEMSAVFPKIMDRIQQSVITTDEVIPTFKDDEDDEYVPAPPGTIIPIQNTPDDIDIENTDDEDDDDLVAGYTVENAFLEEKQEAIVTLKEFADHTGAAFVPYLQQSYQNVYSQIDHPQEDVRKVAVEALSSFIIALFKHNDHLGAENAIKILFPKLAHIIRDDEDISVVIGTVDSIGDVLRAMKTSALPCEELREMLFMCINDVLNGKVACQFDEPGCGGGSAGGNDDEDGDESEYDEALVEAAGNLISVFGNALRPEQFSLYFGRLLPSLLHKLKRAKKRDYMDESRAFVYGALAECFNPLENQTKTYFDTLCPIFVDGLEDSYSQSRQNSVFGLGEMVYYSEEKSYASYPIILQALSTLVATESDQGVLDNICGAISRLVVTNLTLVPLPQVVPVLLKHLPLKNDTEENDMVFRCLKQLYVQSRDILVEYMEQIVVICIHVLYKKECSDDLVRDNVLSLLNQIRENYGDTFNKVANSNADVLNFLHTL